MFPYTYHFNMSYPSELLTYGKSFLPQNNNNNIVNFLQPINT